MALNREALKWVHHYVCTATRTTGTLVRNVSDLESNLKSDADIGTKPSLGLTFKFVSIRRSHFKISNSRAEDYSHSYAQPRLFLFYFDKKSRQNQCLVENGTF